MKENPTIIVKKKKQEHTGGHGGSWKVAYSDFMTSMMAFFMVMWILGLSPDVRAKIQSYFNDPFGNSRTPRTKTMMQLNPPIVNHTQGSKEEQNNLAKMDQQELQHIKKQIQKTLSKFKQPVIQRLLKDIRIRMTTKGLLLEFFEKDRNAFFKIGSAVVTSQARQIFLQIAAILEKSDRNMVLNGYTDARPYPSNSYDNWDLSADRALALKRVLLEGGLQKNQIIDIRAYADHHLRDPQNPYSYTNRRVTILLPYMNSNFNAADLPKDELEMTIKNVTEPSIDLAPAPLPIKQTPQTSTH